MRELPGQQPKTQATDSLQLSIANKVVLRAEGTLAIIVAAVMVLALACIWMGTVELPFGGPEAANRPSPNSQK